MPMPISAPMMPPAAVPTAAPLSAAMIGPAAISAPTPGIASVPLPASQPTAAPTPMPAMPPVVAPSGAFVLCSCAKSLVPRLSGSSAEISLLLKPAAFSSATMFSACSIVRVVQYTDAFMRSLLRGVGLDVQVVVDARDAGHVGGDLFHFHLLLRI